MAIKKHLPPLILDHPLPTLCYDKKTRRVTFANKAAIRFFGYAQKVWQTLFIADFLTIIRDENTSKGFFGMVITKDNQRISVKGYFKTITEKNKKYHVLIIHEFPEENANRGEHLTAEHLRLEKIVLVSHNEIYLIRDKTLRFEYANTSALKNLGYSAEELNKLKLTDLFSFPDEMGLEALLNSLRRSATDRLRLQLKFTRKNGSHYDAEVLMQVLEKDNLFFLIASDNTDKRITEKKLLHTIHEKETLIKEIHHRVKNNLQLISSIIYLKIASLGESDIRNFLEDTRQKIRSIALIHERLLQTGGLDKVEISDYLGKLIHDLETSYFRQDLALEIKTSIDEKLVSLDTAIICGLIVNELITNAIKHAFKGRSAGLIEIGLTEEKNKKFLLTIADDGVSLPGHISPGLTGTFGMQLIDVFVKQLGGSFNIIRENGTTFQIHF